MVHERFEHRKATDVCEIMSDDRLSISKDTLGTCEECGEVCSKRWKNSENGKMICEKCVNKELGKVIEHE